MKLEYNSRCCQNKVSMLPSIRTVKCMMTLSTAVPVALLSLFPHQEPRFLIPLIVPLVYLHGMTVLPEIDDSLVEVPKNKINGVRNLKQSSCLFLKIWLFINSVLIIFYGFLHQGGVFQAASYLHQDLNANPSNVNYHIVTTYMYSLPESFLMQLPSNRVLTKGHKQYSVNRRVHLYEEGSKNLDNVSQKLVDILKNVDTSSGKDKVYLLISASLIEELEYFALKYKLILELEKTFFPHLSLEAFPNIFRYCIDALNFYRNNCDVVSVSQYFWITVNMCKLNLYKISQKDFDTGGTLISEKQLT